MIFFFFVNRFGLKQIFLKLSAHYLHSRTVTFTTATILCKGTIVCASMFECRLWWSHNDNLFHEDVHTMYMVNLTNKFKEKKNQIKVP